MWDFNHQLHKSWQPGGVTDFGILSSDWTDNQGRNETRMENIQPALLLG